MALAPMNAAEWTYPPRDYVLIDTTADVDLEADLGYIPRAIRADDAGTVVFRCADTPDGDPDITMNVGAGEKIDGFVTQIKATTTATIHAAK